MNAAGLFRWWNRAGSHTWEDCWHTLTHDWPRGPRCTLRALSGGQLGTDLLQKFWWDLRERQLTMWGDWTKYEMNNFSLIQSPVVAKPWKTYLDYSSVKSDYYEHISLLNFKRINWPRPVSVFCIYQSGSHSILSYHFFPTHFISLSHMATSRYLVSDITMNPLQHSLTSELSRSKRLHLQKQTHILYF